MNWTGGARFRNHRQSSDRQKQKEYFSNKRTNKRVPSSHSTSSEPTDGSGDGSGQGFSVDLMYLDLISRVTENKVSVKSADSSGKHNNVRHINLDTPQSKNTRFPKTVYLEASPQSSPSKLNLGDDTEDAENPDVDVDGRSHYTVHGGRKFQQVTQYPATSGLQLQFPMHTDISNSSKRNWTGDHTDVLEPQAKQPFLSLPPPAKRQELEREKCDRPMSNTSAPAFNNKPLAPVQNYLFERMLGPAGKVDTKPPHRVTQRPAAVESSNAKGHMPFPCDELPQRKSTEGPQPSHSNAMWHAFTWGTPSTSLPPQLRKASSSSDNTGSLGGEPGARIGTVHEHCKYPIDVERQSSKVMRNNASTTRSLSKRETQKAQEALDEVLMSCSEELESAVNFSEGDQDSLCSVTSTSKADHSQDITDSLVTNEDSPDSAQYSHHPTKSHSPQLGRVKPSLSPAAKRGQSTPDSSLGTYNEADYKSTTKAKANITKQFTPPGNASREEDNVGMSKTADPLPGNKLVPSPCAVNEAKSEHTQVSKCTAEDDRHRQETIQTGRFDENADRQAANTAGDCHQRTPTIRSDLAGNASMCDHERKPEGIAFKSQACASANEEVEGTSKHVEVSNEHSHIGLASTNIAIESDCTESNATGPENPEHSRRSYSYHTSGIDSSTTTPRNKVTPTLTTQCVDEGGSSLIDVQKNQITIDCATCQSSACSEYLDFQPGQQSTKLDASHSPTTLVQGTIDSIPLPTGICGPDSVSKTPLGNQMSAQQNSADKQLSNLDLEAETKEKSGLCTGLQAGCGVIPARGVVSAELTVALSSRVSLPTPPTDIHNDVHHNMPDGLQDMCMDFSTACPVTHSTKEKCSCCQNVLGFVQRLQQVMELQKSRIAILDDKLRELEMEK